MVQAGERTRLVLNLKQATAYKAEIQGKSLLVSLEPVPGPALVASTPSAFAENRNRDTLPLRDVDFRRGADNTGRVIVDLANNQVGVDIRQQGKNLVVEFTKSTLPEGLRRRLDVSDFGTPVQLITTQQIRRPRAHDDRAEGRLGAQRLPEREPVRRRSASAQGRPDQADAGRRATPARSCR